MSYEHQGHPKVHVFNELSGGIADPHQKQKIPYFVNQLPFSPVQRRVDVARQSGRQRACCVEDKDLVPLELHSG